MKLVFSLFIFGLVFGNFTRVDAVDFDTEVFPVLKTYCAKCHMDGESKGKLALDRNVIIKQLEAGGTIVAGNVDKSDLHWTMTLDPDDDSAMPPKGKRVPPADIALIAKWIEEGAKIPSEAPGAPTAVAGGDSAPKETPGVAATKSAQKPYQGTFKNYEGMQVTGKLVRIDGDRAILVLPDEKEYRYPIKMFSPETMKIVEKFQAGTIQ